MTSQFGEENTEGGYDEYVRVLLSEMSTDYHSTNSAVQELDGIQ